MYRVSGAPDRRSPVETASLVGLLNSNAFVRELLLPEAVLIMLDDRQAWDSIVLDEIAPSILTDGRGDFSLDQRHGIAARDSGKQDGTARAIGQLRTSSENVPKRGENVRE